MMVRAGVAGVVSAVVVMGAACLGTRPTPTPDAPLPLEAQSARTVLPEPSPAGEASLEVALSLPEATPVVPKPAGLTGRVRVTGAGSDGVNLRAEPGVTGRRLKGLLDGAELELIGPDRVVEGRTWRNVRDPSARSEGWVAA